ncbi:tricyclene synthase EBOS, chloroplastic-like [Nymphaea colorata]|nr:tricyclene synthase EBOS, chloroplastic-like [Nymphaea colorata]
MIEQVAQLEVIDSLERLGVAYHFESEVRFTEQSGRFSKNLREDVRGLLSLYEASQLECEGETVLEEATAISSEHLRARISCMDQRMWWRDLGLCEHISFARDRLVESYFMAGVKMHEPQFSQYRMQLARVSYLMATMRTSSASISLWDLQAAEQLPQSLRIFYVAVYNTTNQISYTVLRRHGRDITSHMRRVTPRLEESLSNIRAAMIGPILLHAYFFLSQNIEEQAIQQPQSESNIINLSFMIVRLWADLQRSRCMYDSEDGVGVLQHESMDCVYSLIAEPIQTA